MRPSDCGRFDVVIGNPPYGRVTPAPDRRAFFKRSVYGHANLYGLFTDAALHWAKVGGVVGYVTPTSMLSGLYFKALRGLLGAEASPLAVNFVSERDGVFADALQETILATYRRAVEEAGRTGNVGFIAVDAEGNTAFRKAGTFQLPVHQEAPWLLPRAPDQVAFTRRLRSMPHRLSDCGYGVSTGPLVWNRFKDQLHHERKGAFYPVVWAESGHERRGFRMAEREAQSRALVRCQAAKGQLADRHAALRAASAHDGQRTTTPPHRCRDVRSLHPPPQGRHRRKSPEHGARGRAEAERACSRHRRAAQQRRRRCGLPLHQRFRRGIGIRA